MLDTPFTVSTDLDLGTRVASYLVPDGADVTISAGDVPDELPGAIEVGLSYQISDDAFLLKLPNGTRYLVRDGCEILYDAAQGTSDRDISLFLLGSAWGALCYQRGLLPLHASAVAAPNGICAFTGPSGAGKSTLSASLADRGHRFFTDDVLIIDPEKIGEGGSCFAGQKDLKLWKDALKLTGAKKMGPVRDEEGFDKFFASPVQLEGQSFGQLDVLIILSSMTEGAGATEPKIERLRGANALKQLAGSIYRPRYATHIWGRKRVYETLRDLIVSLEVYQFERPFIKSEFSSGLDYIDHWISARSGD